VDTDGVASGSIMLATTDEDAEQDNDENIHPNTGASGMRRRPSKPGNQKETPSLSHRTLNRPKRLSRIYAE
jgi:hypothetical protein